MAIVITKREMVSMLKHYRAERESIDALLAELSRDVDLVYAPSTANITGVAVQQQFDPAKQIDALLMKCDKAKSITRKTLLMIKDKTEVLDRLMFCVSSLPGNLRDVITSIEMSDESMQDYSDRTGKSIATIKRWREAGIDKIYTKLTRRPIETAK